MIKAKAVCKPPRRKPCLEMTIERIVAAVNAVANPGKPAINWFEGYPDARAAVHIEDGRYIREASNPACVFGGRVSDAQVDGLKVVAYEGREGGVFARGAASDVKVCDAVIHIGGPGKGVGGPATGAAVRDHARMTLKNVVIDSYGESRFCTVAEKYGILRVYDSILIAHGVPYGEGLESPRGLMATPPPALEIGGNSRAHCTMSNSLSYFYRSKIICDGWAALSTEAAEGYVYLEANDCDVIVTKKGYGAYADPDCHDRFNRCRFDIDGMAAIVAGEGDMNFAECAAKCASYFCLMHNVNGAPEEVGTLAVRGGSIASQKEVVLVKSHNAEISFDAVAVSAGNGVLVRTIQNDDPCTTAPDDAPYGVNVRFADMDASGDLIHEDPQRGMWIRLKSATLRGAIAGGNIELDAGSRWIATRDSSVTFTADVHPSQIDAPPGVTIMARGAEPGAYALAGGGRLIVTEI